MLVRIKYLKSQMFDTIILTPQTSLSYKVLSSNSTKGYMQFKKKKEPMLQKYIRNEMFKNGAYNLNTLL